MDSYGKLEWVFLERSKQTHFLDLKLWLTSEGKNSATVESLKALYSLVLNLRRNLRKSADRF